MRRISLWSVLLFAAGCSSPPPAARIFIHIDPAMLVRYEVKMEAVVQKLQDDGIKIVGRQGTQVEIRSTRSPESLLALAVGARQGSWIYLRDVARIDVRP